MTSPAPVSGARSVRRAGETTRARRARSASWFTGHNELPERTWETRSLAEVAADVRLSWRECSRRPGHHAQRGGTAGHGGGQARPPEALHLTTLTCSGTVNSSAPGTSTSVFWYFFTAVPCLNWMFLAKRPTPTSRQSQAGDRHFKSSA